MDNYKVLQIKPNHADHISYYKADYLKQMFDEEPVVGQFKYDGERMLIHIDHGNVYCTSRRFSKKTDRYMENQERVPFLVEALSKFKDLDYTVLDCECYAKDWSTIAGILHSLPERARELQLVNHAKFAVFDCLYANGIDMRDKDYASRLVEAVRYVDMFHYEDMHMVAFMNNNLDFSNITNSSLCDSIACEEKWMNSAITLGFEGIVIKSLNRAYYDKGASLKCKKFETVDVVVIDYVQGRGKYLNTVGALRVGYFNDDNKEFTIISNVNCSTDAERDWWRDNWSTARYSVIEVKCQEITSRSLRHPRYIRRRDDKDFTMCTKDTIFKDIE